MEVYVDYFTIAKSFHYIFDENYTQCMQFVRTRTQYKNYLKKSNKKTHKIAHKFVEVSIPYYFQSAIGLIAINPDKYELFNKHKYKETDIYTSSL